ncbi:Hpt domain-containing protein [Roseinatronobacter alkalisoli]|uniref:Hpt domain-containing protein n=1 Tax=Roseinatronobacter alkalisoli TaxID=3028235 RepID=A0ABT5TBB2_9RHOB|nr:Hpt domain-containing protein [Roseinatronobacter sp. HJB301]MDD7972416.1 Hpt domain-containing protein [Roseinatronobacter sp. HJB301]
MTDRDEFLEMFFTECDELLDSLATGLRAMDVPGHEMETVHSVFRAVHSMKGAAAAFGLTDLVTFAHRFETVLDLLRSDRLTADQDVMTVLHRASDLLTDLVAAARQSIPADSTRMQDLLAELDRLIGDDDDAEDDSDLQAAFVPITLDFAPIESPPPATGALPDQHDAGPGIIPHRQRSGGIVACFGAAWRCRSDAGYKERSQTFSMVAG